MGNYTRGFNYDDNYYDLNFGYKEDFFRNCEHDRDLTYNSGINYTTGIIGTLVTKRHGARRLRAVGESRHAPAHTLFWRGETLTSQAQG